jgi:hypothetical protein
VRLCAGRGSQVLQFVQYFVRVPGTGTWVPARGTVQGTNVVRMPVDLLATGSFGAVGKVRLFSLRKG